jgi:thimet oligopeptidase
VLVVACQKSAPPAATTSPSSMKTLESFQSAAAAHHAVLALPEFESTPAAVHATAEGIIARANAALDAVAKQDLSKLTLASTLGALDDINFDIDRDSSRIGFLKETSPDKAIRDAAEDAVKKVQDWAIGVEYREDIYQVVKAFAATKPVLEGEDKLLLDENLRDYRRIGFDLPPAQRKEVEALRKELAVATTDFSTNINEAKNDLIFTAEELKGLPEDFLATIKQPDGRYKISTNITFHRLEVHENAVSAATRKKLFYAEFTLAKEKNVPVLTKMVQLRDTIARKLGYKSWDDYQTEPRMAKTGAIARKFLTDLIQGTEPKFQAEVAELKALKAKDTGEAHPEILAWDWRYYSNQLKKQKYNVDTEQLKVYFPYKQTLEGMFRIYQSIFGLKFEQIVIPNPWTPDIQLWAVTDSATGEPLGCFYLDMFPREGKYNHFAQFGLISGKQLSSGLYQRPTVALVCNFPPSSPDKPSLLSHRDAETLFHEFGHAMHSILTRAKYNRYACTSVARDFVEAPSQMLERWMWDKPTLDSFAADYRDPSKKIPTELLEKMKAAKLALIGINYRRQFSFGLLDLTLHGPHAAGEKIDVVGISNKIIGEVTFPVPADTAFVANFGHLGGYDAGYYGYAWADNLAADMATVFEKAPNGYLDVDAGLRLRHNIYEPGGSVDANALVERFLGRKPDVKPFLKTLGL